MFTVSTTGVDIGIDIGGQSAKIACRLDECIDWHGKEFMRYGIIDSIPIVEDFALMGKNIEKVISDHFPIVNRIAIGCFGPLELTTKKIIKAPNLKAWVKKSFTVWEKIFGCPIILDNDANLAIFAEALMGAGRGYRIVAGFALGTGIGFGVTMHGKIYHGGWDTEGGHQILFPDGRTCGCGQNGCLEAYVGKNGLISQFGVQPNEIKGEENWQWVAHKLAWACVNVTAILNPEVIVFCGGVAQEPGLIEEIDRQYKLMLKVYPREAKLPLIKKGELVPHSGAIGAAMSAKTENPFF